MTRHEIAAASGAFDHPTFRGLDAERRWQLVLTCEACCREAVQRARGRGGRVGKREVALAVGRRLRADGLPRSVWLMLLPVVLRLVGYLLKWRFDL